MKRSKLLFIFIIAIIQLNTLTVFAETLSEEECSIEENSVAVTDIEINEFNKEMEVSEKQTISASVVPNDATNQKITYSSSDTNVATITSSGKITAISEGSTVITLKAEDITKNYTLKVKVGTKKITVNQTYISLNANDQFAIKTSVYPEGAPNELNFKSTNKSVAVVNKNGIITGKSSGSTSIIVSNGDMSKVITVIVKSSISKSIIKNKNQDVENKNCVKEDEQVRQIASLDDHGKLEISASELPVINSNILNELYGTKKTLIVKAKNYTITISGNDIKNVENEFSTKIKFKKTKNGLQVILNDGNKLPGKINIALTSDKNYKHLYLNNKNLNSINDNKFYVDIQGDYLLTQKPVSKRNINIVIISCAAIVLLLLAIIYIIIKKKHWFW